MAIVKVMSSKYGIGLAYHRIIAFNINYVQKKAVICVASYLSKEARAVNNSPLEEIDIDVPVADFHQFAESIPIIQGYMWLKSNVIGFEDAIDDFDIVDPNKYNEETVL